MKKDRVFTKEDFIIVPRTNTTYTVLKKSYRLWIIPYWDEITYLNEDNKESVLIFEKYKEAEDFIENLLH
jgi:hypothetical protein